MATTTLGAEEVKNLNVSSQAEIARSKLAQRTNAKHNQPLIDARVWDAIHTLLPSAGASDDCGLVTRTFGTNAPRIETGDLKNTTTTRYFRMLISLPSDYEATETVTVRVTAGAITTVASSSLTLDVEAYRHVGDGTIGSDLCATSLQSINSLSFSDKDFIITATTLLPGDVLDCRFTLVVTDVATGTEVNGGVATVALLADCR